MKYNGVITLSYLRNIFTWKNLQPTNARERSKQNEEHLCVNFVVNSDKRNNLPTTQPASSSLLPLSNFISTCKNGLKWQRDYLWWMCTFVKVLT